MHVQENPKPASDWEVKRRIKIPTLNDTADVSALEHALMSRVGIRRLVTKVARHKLVVWYDASQTDFQAIVTALEEAGFSPLNNWWFRRKQGWYQFTDANARANSQAPPGACCNKPPR